MINLLPQKHLGDCNLVFIHYNLLERIRKLIYIAEENKLIELLTCCTIIRIYLIIYVFITGHDNVLIEPHFGEINYY